MKLSSLRLLLLLGLLSPLSRQSLFHPMLFLGKFYILQMLGSLCLLHSNTQRVLCVHVERHKRWVVSALEYTSALSQQEEAQGCVIVTLWTLADGLLTPQEERLHLPGSARTMRMLFEGSLIPCYFGNQ